MSTLEAAAAQRRIQYPPPPSRPRNRGSGGRHQIGDHLMSFQDPTPAPQPDPVPPALSSPPSPGRSLTIPLRYIPGTGFALATAITAGITWDYVPQDGTWPLALLGATAMLCDAIVMASRNAGRRPT
ncbi:hypothetical protein [Streptomyces sp. NPDC093591]|uniref:hypothetical protein n=1 Tax=Streptomyces sp. NPDC093591 TaxID=3366044 RepID=UPI0037F5A3BB